MLIPTLFLGDKECILIIAFHPKNARAKYEKLKEILSEANYHTMDTFNPCIIANVNADHFFASQSNIEALLEKGDVINIISCTEKGLGYSVLMKRLDNDSEIRPVVGNLWDIPWMK
jgi:hypothetical protein